MMGRKIEPVVREFDVPMDGRWRVVDEIRGALAYYRIIQGRPIFQGRIPGGIEPQTTNRELYQVFFHHGPFER